MQKETRRNSAAGSTKPNPPRKLTRAEKKQIAEIIRQAKGDGKAHTAQQTIPYIQMYPDGICKVTGRKYSKTVAFEMGTEGDGLSQETIASTDYVARIPMSHNVDSLNVAAAAAVAFWQLRPK